MHLVYTCVYVVYHSSGIFCGFKFILIYTHSYNTHLNDNKKNVTTNVVHTN